MWSRDRVDLFSRSRSSWDEDDEEALRWAALEKLPTYDRARTAVLAMPEWEIKEVNADKLGAQQRIALDGDDHEVWIELPTIEVRYENLNMEVEAEAEAYVGSRGLPTILNTYANVLESVFDVYP
ncbi:Pleiotropic drug resistance protein 4 [Hordeum vulgare]|nr:Pleiotropic drug resistance protein 4 [Hordeum vulgare]